MSDPGRIFGDRYELDEELGSGGMATVYRGTDPHRVRLEAGVWQLPDASTDPRKGDSRGRWVETRDG